MLKGSISQRTVDLGLIKRVRKRDRTLGSFHAAQCSIIMLLVMPVSLASSLVEKLVLTQFEIFNTVHRFCGHTSFQILIGPDDAEEIIRSGDWSCQVCSSVHIVLLNSRSMSRTFSITLLGITSDICV